VSKKYKGKTCTYCGRPGISEAPDHVVAREFFAVHARRDLPQVPACRDCNNAKSKLEHYLTAVLPFGGQHEGARETLEGMVPGRLSKNERLRRELNAGRSRLWVTLPSGVSAPLMVIPIELSKLLALFEMIATGLLWHHWGVRVRLGEDRIKAAVLTSGGEEFFDHFLGLPAAAKVNVDLGSGTFRYEGSLGVGLPHVSVWRLWIYGGVRFGDPDMPDEAGARIGVSIGPKH
jgi:hypothetical protein